MTNLQLPFDDEDDLSKPVLKAVLKELGPLLLQRGVTNFNVCRIMHMLKSRNAFKLLDPNVNWETFLKKNKIRITYSNANKAARLYQTHLDLKYADDTMQRILGEFGLSRASELLRNLTVRKSLPALRKMYDNELQSRDRGNQYHLEIERRKAARFDRTLTKLGMSTRSTGRKDNASEAVQLLAENYERLLAYCKGDENMPVQKTCKKGNLKAVSKAA